MVFYFNIMEFFTLARYSIGKSYLLTTITQCSFSGECYLYIGSQSNLKYTWMDHEDYLVALSDLESVYKNMPNNVTLVCGGGEPVKNIADFFPNSFIMDSVRNKSISDISFIESLDLVEELRNLQLADYVNSSIFGYKETLKNLFRIILAPVLYKTVHINFNISKCKGVLLSGPSGNGKTKLARYFANEYLIACGQGGVLHCPSVAQLLGESFGESEQNIRNLFKANANFQNVVILDDLDCLTPPRNNDNENGTTSRIITTLLNEIDGIGWSNTLVICCSNRPWEIDVGMRRSGRFFTVEVGFPNLEDRIAILEGLKVLPHKLEQIPGLAKACDGLSCGELVALKREAGYLALRKPFGNTSGSIPTVDLEHFMSSLLVPNE